MHSGLLSGQATLRLYRFSIERFDVTRLRKILSLSALVLAIAAVAGIRSCNSGIEDNERFTAAVMEFVASPQTEVSVTRLTPPGWSTVCVASSDDIEFRRLKNIDARQRKMREIFAASHPTLESGEWFLALYDGGSTPEKVLATHAIGYVSSKRRTPEMLSAIGNVEICLGRMEAMLVKAPGTSMVYLAQNKRSVQVTVPPNIPWWISPTVEKLKAP